MKNHGSIHYICLFGQNTKQLFSNFEPWKPQECMGLWGLGTDTSCLKNKCNFSNKVTGDHLNSKVFQTIQNMHFFYINTNASLQRLDEVCHCS